MQNKFSELLHVSPIQIKVFIGTFLAMFLIVTLQHIGVHSPFTLRHVTFSTIMADLASWQDSKYNQSQRKGGI